MITALKNRVWGVGVSRVGQFLGNKCLLIFNKNTQLSSLTFLLEKTVENYDSIKEKRDCVKTIFVSLLNPSFGLMHRFSREWASKEPSCYSKSHANSGKQFWFPLQHPNNGKVWISEHQRRTCTCNRALVLVARQ